MRSILASLPFIVLTFLCWGNYGPLMRNGQFGMDQSHLRPFICVGISYFVIAVLIPLFYLFTKGEDGNWNVAGLFWCLLAGTLSAVGAFGIILAFENRGSPIYVMPLVFGCAPVVNTLVAMLMNNTYRLASWLFYVCVILVAVGAAGVLLFVPSPKVEIQENKDGSITITKEDLTDKSSQTWNANNLQELESNEKLADAFDIYKRNKSLSVVEFLLVIASIALAATCWGAYGPILHRGQSKMGESRLRPFLCVGAAYFAVAVVVPLILLSTRPEEGSWLPDGNPSGILWSLAAGVVGAVSALGIIMAFRFGGRPIYVMPLVFGCAPVVNTFTMITGQGTWSEVGQLFIAALITVILGAFGVILFAPRSSAKADNPKDETAIPTKGQSSVEEDSSDQESQPEKGHLDDATSESKPSPTIDSTSPQTSTPPSDSESGAASDVRPND